MTTPEFSGSSYSRKTMLLSAHISFRVLGHAVTLTSPRCALLNKSIRVRDCPIPPPIEKEIAMSRVAW
jgi:hypothetical protein